MPREQGAHHTQISLKGQGPVWRSSDDNIWNKATAHPEVKVSKYKNSPLSLSKQKNVNKGETERDDRTRAVTGHKYLHTIERTSQVKEK